jgi:hypothetical protein
MKHIIIGQIMLWMNIASVITGYMIIKDFPLGEFTFVLIGFIGAIGSGANLVFAIMVQVKGYSALKIIE